MPCLPHTKDAHFNTLFLFWAWMGTRMGWPRRWPVLPGWSRGVPRGLVLGSGLFSIFINHLAFVWLWSCLSFLPIARWRRSRTISLSVPLKRRWQTWIRSSCVGKRSPCGIWSWILISIHEITNIFWSWNKILTVNWKNFLNKTWT